MIIIVIDVIDVSEWNFWKFNYILKVNKSYK